MKKTGLLISLTSGLSLTMALLWVLGGQNSPAVAAPEAERAQYFPSAPVEPIPHPILSDVRIRRAIAHCTDKDALIASVYPALTPAEREELIMDTFILKTSWAYSPPSTTYPYNPTLGQDLLNEAGWILPPGADYRLKDGKELYLQLNTTDSPLRLIFLPIFEDQMKTCGIHVVRNHQPTWFFGRYTGIQVRDFELGEYAWILEDDPGGAELYACDQVPSPANEWSDQNFMGWCNQAASDAIVQASDTGLPQDQRKALYATFIDLFAEDIPSLPLFLREGSTTFEHIDFNLETYAQDGELTPAGTGGAGLSYTDYQGNQHTVDAPAGTVTQTVTLRYYPLVSNANPPPENMLAANAFRLTAITGGIPQDTFPLAEPITVTVGYTVTDIEYNLNEASLALYIWDGDSSSWENASETCPMEDRYKWLDIAADLYEVRVCHLSEFGLFGYGGENVRMGVNYGLDHATGMYEVGHTFWITVTNSGGAPKAYATATTTPAGTGPDFAWSDGFWVEKDDWSDPSLDILPGDRIHYQSDDGFAETVQVGTITSRLNPSADTVAGTITAPGFVELLEGFAGQWGIFWQEFTVDPDGGSYFVDFPHFNLTPGMDVSVGYREPDLDSVINVFETPLHGIYLPGVLKDNAP